MAYRSREVERYTPDHNLAIEAIRTVTARLGDALSRLDSLESGGVLDVTRRRQFPELENAMKTVSCAGTVLVTLNQ